MGEVSSEGARGTFERLHGAGLTGSDAAKVMGEERTEAIGGALARGTSDRVEGEGPAGSIPAPPDVSLRWEDVRSRYEMLFEQRYGHTDWTWGQAEPTYRAAWQMANAPQWRGRSWSEAKAQARDRLGGVLAGMPWEEAEAGVGDVWQDVADEVRPGRQGGDESQVWEPDAGTGAEGRAA